MRMAYTQLYDLNKEIMKGYEIRRNNHMELLECLKIINQAIQKAARLRGDNLVIMLGISISYTLVLVDTV